MDQNALQPVRKRVEVPLASEAAFDLFTVRMQEWWPFDSHSVYEGRHTEFRFESREGGRIVETGPDGREAVWGTIREVSRPGRVVFTWHPGRGPEAAQLVELTFVAVSGGTAVELVHSGWEKLGDRAPSVRENYETGWDYVFVERFGGAARTAADG